MIVEPRDGGQCGPRGQPADPASRVRGRKRDRRRQEADPDGVPPRPRHRPRMQRAGVRDVARQRERAAPQQPDGDRGERCRQCRRGENGLVHRLGRCRTRRAVFAGEIAVYKQRSTAQPALRPEVIAEKRAVPPDAWPEPGRNHPFPVADHHFSAPSARSAAPCAPAASVVASAQQRANAYECARGVTLPTVSPVWHNGSQLLVRVEKVPMAGAKGGFLAKFFR